MVTQTQDIPQISRQSVIPLYYQLKEILRRQIRSREFKVGEMLPSEHELANTYKVSRHVARRALAELALEGLVVSRKGVGSFVNRPRLTKQLGILGSFTESIKAVAPNSAVKVIHKEIEPAPTTARVAFALPEGSRIVHIQRLGMIEGEPIAVTSAYYPLEIGKLFMSCKLGDQSLYRLLDEHLQIRPYRADWILSSIPASPELVAILNVREGFPILCNWGTTYDDQEKPFEYSELSYRSDRIEFAITAFRRSSSDKDTVFVDM